jgi:hypothetical protein
VPLKNSNDDFLYAIYTSDEVKLRMNLPHQSNIELKLFDVLGREMAIIARGNFEEGSHEFLLPKMPNGIYFAKLEQDGNVMIVKLAVRATH